MTCTYDAAHSLPAGSATVLVRRIALIMYYTLALCTRAVALVKQNCFFTPFERPQEKQPGSIILCKLYATCLHNAIYLVSLCRFLQQLTGKHRTRDSQSYLIDVCMRMNFIGAKHATLACLFI